MAARAGEQILDGRIGNGRVGSDRQRQFQLCFTRNANIRTDEPRHRGIEMRRGAGLDIPGCSYGHQQVDSIAVAVIAESVDDEALRHRPHDVAGGKASRQGPGNLGRQTGIPRVAPVGMPARRDIEVQIDPQSGPRTDARRLRHQARGHRMRRIGRPHRRGRREREADNRGKPQCPPRDIP